MNIFASSACPIESAKFLDNKRVIKMILESAQLLSTALRSLGYDHPDLYKDTHVNHPCSVWVRESWANYWWLYRHWIALMNEYTARYGRVHASSRLRELLLPPTVITEEPTTFANCAAHGSLGISYKHMDDVHMAYQLYLNDRWDTDAREPSWEAVI